MVVDFAFSSLADVKSVNDVEVALRIDRLQVIQQPTPATHHHQQAPPTGVILLVRSQVLRQIAYPGRQDGDLHFGEPVSLSARRKSPIKTVLRSFVMDICYRDFSTLAAFPCFFLPKHRNCQNGLELSLCFYGLQNSRKIVYHRELPLQLQIPAGSLTLSSLLAGPIGPPVGPRSTPSRQTAHGQSGARRRAKELPATRPKHRLAGRQKMGLASEHRRGKRAAKNGPAASRSEGACPNPATSGYAGFVC